jgi:hypothetical protein
MRCGDSLVIAGGCILSSVSKTARPHSTGILGSHPSQKAREEWPTALKDFEGTMIFVSHDRMFLRGLGSRVLEPGGESGTDRTPTIYPGSYVEYVQKLGHEAPGIYS